MYSDFEYCISDFTLERDPGDYWYDCAILEASDILRKFDKGDWSRLLIDLGGKNDLWKKRLVECLGDLHVAYEVEVILCIINTSDEDLLISCFDALRLVDLSKLARWEQEYLLLRVYSLLDEASSPVRAILDNFCEKLNS
ncbi:hypothetical protein ACNFIA_03565 [Pseudomonas sp. NY15437]|uniref:hypothetical protein n=1 Tax=Pseudomonas sp. NY15437 TaxID=3400360 RepID=UPI003A88B493